MCNRVTCISLRNKDHIFLQGNDVGHDEAACRDARSIYFDCDPRSFMHMSVPYVDTFQLN